MLAAATASSAARSTSPACSKKDGKAYKCTLCSDRVAVGLEPACAKTCPTGAITFGSREDMLQHAAGRIADFKERGYRQAGLYNPTRSGRDACMYVLQHADRPELYQGLPKDPGISPLVDLWKDIAKTLMNIGLGAAILAGVFHYLTQGPNEVTEEEEETL